MSVSASDDVGVAQVSIIVDGVQVASTTTAPYAFQVDIRSLAGGLHQFAAAARDAAGNVAVANSMSFWTR